METTEVEVGKNFVWGIRYKMPYKTRKFENACPPINNECKLWF
jgi:hypothetical protein